MSTPNRAMPVIPILNLNSQSVVDANIASTTPEPTLVAAFADIATRLQQQNPAADVTESSQAFNEFLDAATLLDASYGSDSLLPVADADMAADEALRAGAHLQATLARYSMDADLPQLDAVIIGIGLWCMRHQLPILAAEPIVNALARRANSAQTRQETAATYALMQGFVAHLQPQLSSDLERSNPERPWRILNVNFAITAIRTGDTAMMRYAFDRLNEALPDECAGFYAEAAAHAAQPGFPVEISSLIANEQRRFAAMH